MHSLTSVFSRKFLKKDIEICVRTVIMNMYTTFERRCVYLRSFTHNLEFLHLSSSSNGVVTQRIWPCSGTKKWNSLEHDTLKY